MSDEYIIVKDNRTDGRVALWEKDPAHPDGEIFVGGGNTVTAGRTPAVLNLIREGVLVEVTGNDAAEFLNTQQARDDEAPALVAPEPPAGGAKGKGK